MNKKFDNSCNQKIPLSYRGPNLSLYLSPPINKKISSSEIKESILINRKTSLETLLNILKKFQISYFSNNNKLYQKQMLLTLKDNLNLMLEEKNKSFKYMKTQNEIKKKKMQKILYPSSKEMKQKQYDLTSYNTKITSYLNEKNQLEILNFQIKNEIEKTDFLIGQNKETVSYIKSLPFYFEENKEIFCNNNYENYKNISLFFMEIIRKIRKKFINIVKEKMKKDIEIKTLSEQINYIKDNIDEYDENGYKKYIDTDEIIQEESKEYTRSNNQSKRNSLSSMHNKNLLKRFSNVSSFGSLSLYKKKDKLNNNNLIYISKINDSKVNNYLNMNINVNINLNNKFLPQQSFNSSLDSDNIDENELTNSEYEMDLNENNKITIIPINTNENKNKKLNKGEGNSFILSMKEKKSKNTSCEFTAISDD